MIPNKVAVLGGGSFGTVLANIAASNGNEVDCGSEMQSKL